MTPVFLTEPEASAELEAAALWHEGDSAQPELRDCSVIPDVRELQRTIEQARVYDGKPLQCILIVRP